MASPPAVVRIFTTQKRKMTSGTFAATGAGNMRPIKGTWPPVGARTPGTRAAPELSVLEPTWQFPPHAGPNCSSGVVGKDQLGPERLERGQGKDNCRVFLEGIVSQVRECGGVSADDC